MKGAMNRSALGGAIVWCGVYLTLCGLLGWTLAAKVAP